MVKNVSIMAKREEQAKWRKILYERQPYSDYYSGGDEFLKDLKTNGEFFLLSLVKYSFLEAVCGACRVVLHEEAIVIYAIIFSWIEDLNDGALYIFAWLIAIVLPFYVVHSKLAAVTWSILYDHFLTLLTLVFFGYALTPIIRTLTDTVSTDTIYAMSTILFILSFLFHDYAMNAPLVSMVFSVNLSLAASICLVSRIKSDEMAFNLLAISMTLFSYWPILRNELTLRYSLSPLLLVCFFCPSTTVILYCYSTKLLAFLQFSLHLFVVIICPWIFIKMQPLKNTIHGPWDEACLDAMRMSKIESK
ncbi:unnamed protein product [Anisakis simplex]|uniref:Phosphatidylinositol N-acetylglucosaminyltransferase subunit C n=1 Tax=Anisakis simplex TaxID=6269 RepID=A0A0M3JSQ8_ANISI|nr:unnamed protein product [Anisakis simplex]